MRKRFIVIILVLGVLLAPAIAFAEDYGGSDGGDFSDRVIYGPNVLDIQSGSYGVQVYAGNKFNAALCVLGFDGYDSRFTNDVKAYLSNESTGGSFYEFSNLFTNNNDPNYVGSGVGGISYTSSIGLNNTLYGSQFVWAAIYSDSLRAAAYARVEEVLAGNVGTGGGGGTSGKTYTMPIWAAKTSNQQNGWNGNQVYVINGVKYYTFTGDNQYQIAEPVSITVNDSVQTYIERYLQSGGTTYIFGFAQSGSNQVMRVIHYDEGITITPISITVYKHGVQDTMYGYYRVTCSERTNYQLLQFNATYEPNTNHLVMDNSLTVNESQSFFNANSSSTVSPAFFALDISADGNGGGAPVVPPPLPSALMSRAKKAGETVDELFALK